MMRSLVLHLAPTASVIAVEVFMKCRFFILLLAALLPGATLEAQHKYPGNLTPVPTDNPPANASPAQNQQGSADANPGMSAKPNSMQSNGTQPGAPQSSTQRQGPAVSSTGPSSGERQLSYEIKVDGSRPWSDTGIQLLPGDRVAVTSTGSLDYNQAKATPDGLARSWQEVITSLPVNNAGIGALIGRIGEKNVEMPFLIGSSKEFNANRAGRLFLGINEGSANAGSGAYAVSVKITPASAKRLQSLAPIKLPDGIWDKVPRRVSDQDGNKGDMVNFMIIGPQEGMQKAFSDAGWVLVDKTKQDAVLHALLSTYSKKAYTEMPMSELYLFDRPQDFGYAHAEPVQVVQTRHHLRVWKAPFEIDGQPVWVGAATHDIGFEHDNRSAKMSAITHKIDTEIYVERDFVGDTLNATGDLANVAKITPPDPLQGTTKTATGGEFHSDGQVLVMKLTD
jgi:LssY C-terminus